MHLLSMNTCMGCVYMYNGDNELSDKILSSYQAWKVSNEYADQYDFSEITSHSCRSIFVSNVYHIVDFELNTFQANGFLYLSN